MAVTLEALDYSRPVQPLFAQAARSGIIHSVFPKALNIVVGDTLFVLLSSEVQRMPNGARLPAIVMEQLYAKLSPGTEVSIGDNRLYIPALDLSIHLPDEAAWEPVPAIVAHGWHRSPVAQHACMLARHLAHRSQQEGLASLVKPLLLHQAAQETPLAKIALPALRLLVRATLQQDITGVEKAARGLAGLGPGLTPSGDDTLGGFIGVLALLSTQLSVDARPRKHLAALIANAARPRTTILSAMLLTHAARGEMAEHVGDLLTSLALPVAASDAVLQAAERVLAYGACSGGDTLLGILLGLQATDIDYPIDYIGENYGYTGATQAQYLL
ncbi:MAG TPA: DUF2877 domain-containing protein [Ktedonobacteraceae bacterium]|nr:DUF2877 domain-containing protein [Ktedonobacteraceae bacterium]